MFDHPDNDGGQRVRSGGAAGKKIAGVKFATSHHPTAMDRYLAIVRAFATRYDADERLAFVTSAETPYEPSLKGGLYREATARAAIFRLTEMPAFFARTPSGVLGAWWSFGGGDRERDRCAQAMLDAGGGFGFPDLDGTMKGGHYNSSFRPHVLANGGKWPCWMGVEWGDLMPDRTGPKFPENQIESGDRTKTNFIWWVPANRRKDGGYDFDTNVRNYFRAYPTAGMTLERPLTTC